MYSRTATEKKEAKRASRIFYQTHCKECKCELSENEIEYCDDCNNEFENFEKACVLLSCLFPKQDEDIVLKVVRKVMHEEYKSYSPISKKQIDRAKSILKRITNK